MLSPDQAIILNEVIDSVHSLFPNLMILGVLCVFLSYLPIRESVSKLETWYLYVIGGFGTLFVLYLLSQGFLGGCVIHIPQNWLAQEFIPDRSQWWEFGLYGREDWMLPLWTLRLLYILLSLYSSWRLVMYYQKFIQHRPVLLLTD